MSVASTKFLYFSIGQFKLVWIENSYPNFQFVLFQPSWPKNGPQTPLFEVEHLCLYTYRFKLHNFTLNNNEIISSTSRSFSLWGDHLVWLDDLFVTYWWSPQSGLFAQKLFLFWPKIGIFCSDYCHICHICQILVLRDEKHKGVAVKVEDLH